MRSCTRESAEVKVRCHESVVHVRLILTLGREEPCCKAEGDDYYESNERCPAVYVSFPVQYAAEAHYPLAMMCVCEGG